MDTDSPCINHGVSVSSNGYGNAYLDGKYIQAHRKAYLEHHDLAPEYIAGQVVRHTCDNKSCINPLHLLLGTQADNMQDMITRNRQGPKPVPPVLTMEQAREVRARYVPGVQGKPSPNGQAAIARDYGVSPAVIQKIVSNLTYKE